MLLLSVCESCSADCRCHVSKYILVVVPFCLQITDVPTCATDESCKDEFDFDMQNVIPAHSQLDSGKPMVRSSISKI